ncbi:hypothetical protein ALQ33_00770 [Pseudomonas syringae pv. philadelphi]|uniref:Acetyl-CoA hydrolase/transferase C-terminal domain-containing protein n=1 Tax=Pseudomonas syringae pv. philadelphi TaxID=251706 RepID=A0A3M3YMN1_9PSED|nr:hypothetical protein ALQ33_00770 [Pseudomonas syringae pv. philadelphi]
MPYSCSIEQAVDHVLAQLPEHIHLGMPLGLGKPNRFVNALYQRISQLPERRLTIYTALTLGRPTPGEGLQARFLEPFLERTFGDYPELDYLAALRRDKLPPNIRVQQFFMQPGSLLDSAPAQQDYVSSNYSHAARDINANGLNLIAQLVARDEQRPGTLSLSCNPDVTLDLLPMIAKRRAAGETILLLGQVHIDLPYMPGDSELDIEAFDLLLDEDERSTLFSTPNMPVGYQDHLIGLHTSTLVRDGGTLQIGIGSMGDALTGALLARQADNETWRRLLADLNMSNWQTLIDREGGTQPFANGLYGCSEMFVNGLLVLADAGIVRRKVYADAELQRLANMGTLDEAAHPDGVVVHGGFFLGPASFYERLRELPAERLAQFNMTAISYINELYGQEDLKRLQRRDARFINSAFTVTLMGAAVADQLEGGRVLSGVGGQYNFVAQAHALEGARSILMLRSWRESGGEVSSNIVWQYGHTTIPRHLRIRHRRPSGSDGRHSDRTDSEYHRLAISAWLDRAGAEGWQAAQGFPARPALHAEHAGAAAGHRSALPVAVYRIPTGLRLHCRRTRPAARAELAEKQTQAERDSRFGQSHPRRAGTGSLPAALATHAAGQSTGPARGVLPAAAAGRAAEYNRADELISLAEPDKWG